MKRTYSRIICCSHLGCGEAGHYSYNTQREYSEAFDRIKEWRCQRHTNPNTLLTPTNLKTETTLLCKGLFTKDGSVLGKFWQEPKDFGTEKCNSGFQYGNGYKAFAEDFPEGTIITITTSVNLPTETD